MTKDSSDGSRTQIIVGLLGFLGVVITAILTIYAPIIQDSIRQKNQQPTLPPMVITATFEPTFTPVPTDTAAPGAPTSTPAPATDTPLPSPTNIPPLAVGDDWPANCISALWTVYPPAEVVASNGCLNQPVDKFYTTNGHLAFLYSGSVPSAEIHGIFTKLPNSGKLSLNFSLGQVENGEILVGVLGAPNVDSNGALLVIPATNNFDKAKMLVKSMPGQNLFAQSSGPVDSASGVFDVLFEFDSGEVTTTLRSGQINLGSVQALASERWLFIGYQLFNGGNQLKAEFFNLKIVQ